MGLFLVTFAVFYAYNWTNFWEGLSSGLMHAVLPGLIFWLISFLPWSLLVFAICHFMRWRRARSYLTLAPSALLLLAAFASPLLWPVDPHKRFESATGVALPKEAAEIEYHFSGGGFVDSRDRYYFPCSPETVQGLIHSLQLQEREEWNPEHEPQPSFFTPDLPDPRTWDSFRWFSSDLREGRFVELFTDKEGTKAFVFTGSI